jgi:hypothetical protein
MRARPLTLTMTVMSMRIGLALTLCVAAAPAAGAQRSDAAAPPEVVAARFFAAVAAERWAEAVGYLDVAPLERHRQETAAAARAPGARREPTVEDLLRGEPDMPRAVAEYRVRKQREARARYGDLVAHEFAHVADPAALARLTPEVAAARWLEAQDDRYEIRRQLAARGCRAEPTDPPLAQPPHRILGTVVRDSAAYVLHEDPEWADAVGRGWAGSGPQVLQLRRAADGRWRIAARHDLLRRANTMVGISECPRRGDARPPT